MKARKLENTKKVPLVFLRAFVMGLFFLELVQYRRSSEYDGQATQRL